MIKGSATGELAAHQTKALAATWPPLEKLPTPAQLRAVLAVVDHGSFSAAATELGLSQSSVSQAIKQLESSLATHLFLRSARGAEPTAVGERVAAQARQVLALLQQLRAEATTKDGMVGTDEAVAGTVRIASFRSIAAHLLPAVLARLRARHPALRFEVDDGCLQVRDAERAVLSGKAHVGLGRLPMSTDLLTFEFARDEYAIVLPTTTSPEPADVWARLRRLPLIQHGGEATHPDIVDLLEAQDLNPVPLLQMSEDSSILAAVARGVGYAVMPRLAVEPLPPGIQLHALPRPVPRHLGLGVRPSLMSLPMVHAVVNAFLDKDLLAGASPHVTM